MSSPTNGLDRELLGEDSNNGGEATMAKANGGSDHGAWEGSHGAEFNPINATAGTLIKVSGNGDELDSGDVSQKSCGLPHSSSTYVLSFITDIPFLNIHTLYSSL